MGSKRYSESERLRYLEEFKKSGLSQRSFSKAHGIHETTFSGWLNRYLRQKKASPLESSSSKVILSKIELGNPESLKTIEVELLNRIKVHVPCDRSSDLFDLVRGLSRC